MNLILFLVVTLLRKIAIYGAQKPTRRLTEVNVPIASDCLVRLVNQIIDSPYFFENTNGATNAGNGDTSGTIITVFLYPLLQFINKIIRFLIAWRV